MQAHHGWYKDSGCSSSIYQFHDPHITPFFSRPTVAHPFVKEEIINEARRDVEQFLWGQFVAIKSASIQLRRQRQWSSDGDISETAEASGGLFAYTSMVVRYIDNPSYGDPVSHLGNVLGIIENIDLSKGFQLFAQLDALYTHIISKILRQNKANTRRLLLLCAGGTDWNHLPFRYCCNMLGMSKSAVYEATRHFCNRCLTSICKFCERLFMTAHPSMPAHHSGCSTSIHQPVQ
jgi:hypothetical protein